MRPLDFASSAFLCFGVLVLLGGGSIALKLFSTSVLTASAFAVNTVVGGALLRSGMILLPSLAHSDSVLGPNNLSKIQI